MRTGFYALLVVGILFAFSEAFTFPWQTKSVNPLGMKISY